MYQKDPEMMQKCPQSSSNLINNTENIIDFRNNFCWPGGLREALSISLQCQHPSWLPSAPAVLACTLSPPPPLAIPACHRPHPPNTPVVPACIVPSRCLDGLTDGRTDGQTDGQMDGQLDGQTVGQTDGWTDRQAVGRTDSQ